MAFKNLLLIVFVSQYLGSNAMSITIKGNSTITKKSLSSHNGTYWVGNETKGLTLLDVDRLFVSYVGEWKPRQKRQKADDSASDKYAQAAKMGQMRLLHLFLQMIKNLWSRDYIGAQYPLHNKSAVEFAQLLKQKVVLPLSPDINRKANKKIRDE